MKNRIIKIAVIASVLVFSTIAVNVSLSNANDNFSILMDNVEALANGETSGGGDCTMYLDGKTDNMLTYMNARNIAGGYLAGCKKKCDRICTVKDSPNITIDFN